MKFRNVFTNPQDINDIRKGSEISALILNELKDSVKVGVSAGDVDSLADDLCAKYGVLPAFKGVEGVKEPFQNSVCISVNDEILHGVPHKHKIFKDGDIVKVDFGIIHKGFYTDHCVTVGLGDISKREKQLIATAKLCVDTAVKEAVVGNRVGDISYALESVANLGNFDFVTSYCGHGIGKNLHESPEISSWGDKGTGVDLVEGMVLCIENQITIGSADLKLDSDGWTLRTIDGSKGAMFEHMVIVRKNKPEILTLLS